MDRSTAVGTASSGGASAGTLRTYAADWALFADWCLSIGWAALPADAGTVLAYLELMPAAQGTLRRRAVAIDAVHRAAGFDPPGRHLSVRAALGFAVPSPRLDPDDVARALGESTVRGWPEGVFGRRDACLLVVVGLLAWTRERARTARVDQLELDAVPMAEDPGPCPRCAITRWLRIRSLAHRGAWTTVRRSMAGQGAARAFDEPVHDCAQPVLGLGLQPLLVPIDRHGWADESTRLSVRSMSTLVAAALARAPLPRANLMDDVPLARPAAPAWTVERAEAASAKRRGAVSDLQDVDGLLDDVSARADAMLAAMDALLKG